MARTKAGLVVGSQPELYKGTMHATAGEAADGLPLEGALRSALADAGAGSDREY
ncbi:MAG: hypothetical protein ABUL62_19400 [Myxococcales bacterium]